MARGCVWRLYCLGYNHRTEWHPKVWKDLFRLRNPRHGCPPPPIKILDSSPVPSCLSLSMSLPCKNPSPKHLRSEQGGRFWYADVTWLHRPLPLAPAIAQQAREASGDVLER